MNVHIGIGREGRQKTDQGSSREPEISEALDRRLPLSVTSRQQRFRPRQNWRCPQSFLMIIGGTREEGALHQPSFLASLLPAPHLSGSKSRSRTHAAAPITRLPSENRSPEKKMVAMSRLEKECTILWGNQKWEPQV